jgi:predicted AlkP superfamily phosphohydrolase/phosphomutase
VAKEINNFDRRDFLKGASLATGTALLGLSSQNVLGDGQSSPSGKKIIVIGIDGMDPRLSEKLMAAGKLPNLNNLRQMGGYSPLGTSMPPQSPVAWANFINGAGPGSHGIFDFIHRDPARQCYPFYAAAETVPGKGFLQMGRHKIQLSFWPFNHKPAETILRRAGVPFWDYLDEASIKSVFYNLPSNYPASESKYGNHRCLSGMGTPDLLGTYGTYQHYAEDGPVRTKNEGGGMRSMLFFENETAKARLTGPTHTLLQEPKPIEIEFLVHRDQDAGAAVIEIQKNKILLKKGQWSKWVKVDFELSMPGIMLNKHISGICRFYLQEIQPNFRLYVTPVNTDPSKPAIKLTEPKDFMTDISSKLGLFYTTGFQEDHKALSNKVFTDDDFVEQAEIVLQERLRLMDYAFSNYKDGLLFFYFSSTDLQSHMFWWDSDKKHPLRSDENAKKYFNHIQNLYSRLDSVVGDILKKYGNDALVIVMSDHGFANFGRQFNLNSWLRENDYINPPSATSVLRDVDWSKTRAYGLGINGLYINLAGRERDGIVGDGDEKEQLLRELTDKLEAVQDTDGSKVIHKVHRTDKKYKGGETKMAPDLLVGYSRGYRASWDTCLGDMSKEVLSDNDSAWSADHCADVSQVPGVLFCNRPIAKQAPALIDIAPSILHEFGLKIPETMEGKDIFKSNYLADKE